MKTLFEKLTPESRLRLDEMKQLYPSFGMVIEMSLNSKLSYIELTIAEAQSLTIQLTDNAFSLEGLKSIFDETK